MGKGLTTPLRGGEAASRVPHKHEVAGASPAPATLTNPTTNQSDTMQIVVTAEHIRAGQARSCSSCPIALAIQARVAAHCVEVHSASVHIQHWQFGGWTSHRLPPEARRFIAAFDAGAGVAPFEFELPIGPGHDPDPTNTPAAIAA